MGQMKFSGSDCRASTTSASASSSTWPPASRTRFCNSLISLISLPSSCERTASSSTWFRRARSSSVQSKPSAASAWEEEEG